MSGPVLNADHYIVLGARGFEAASRGDAVYRNAAMGLRAIIQLCFDDDALKLPTEHFDDLKAALRSAIGSVGEFVEEPSKLALQVGLCAAQAIVNLFGRSRHDERCATTRVMYEDMLDHVKLLAAQLDILDCGSAIEVRGNLWLRSLQMQQFQDANALTISNVTLN